MILRTESRRAKTKSCGSAREKKAARFLILKTMIKAGKAVLSTPKNKQTAIRGNVFADILAAGT